MNVAVVCASCGGNGSVAAVAVRQARELAKHFDRVTLLSDSFPTAAQDGVRRSLLRSVKHGWLGRFAHVPNEYGFCRSARSALGRLREQEGLQMVIFEGHAPAAIAGIPLKRKHGVPYAVVTHGDIFDRPKGTYDPRLTAFYRAVTPRAYRNADLVVALSPHMAECALRGGAPPAVVHVLPNGIDPDDFGAAGAVENERDRGSGDDRALDVLYVGSMAAHKGVGTLLEAVRILCEAGVELRLQMAGSGPEEGRLKALAQALPKDDAVRFLGPRPRSELGALYRQADVVCVPSLSDPLPTVVLEALASGTPVVGSNVGGIPSMVEDGSNGILVPPGDARALADALKELAVKPDKRDALAARARESVLPRFSWTSIGDQLSDLIRAVVASRVGSTPR